LARDSTDPGLEPGWVEEKIRKEKTRYDPARPGYNLLIFIFFYYVVLIFFKNILTRTI
jgi:hypothetical protein